MGALTGLAALLDSVRFRSIQSNAGIGFELKVIAAVVVGGTSINGGRGSLYGTLLGVAILGTIGPALTFLGINAFWEKAIQGAIILWAVVMDAVLARARGMPSRVRYEAVLAGVLLLEAALFSVTRHNFFTRANLFEIVRSERGTGAAVDRVDCRDRHGRYRSFRGIDYGVGGGGFWSGLA